MPIGAASAPAGPRVGGRKINTTQQPLLPATALAAGMLLAIAFLYTLPHAFASAANARALCATLLAGLLALFLVEKCIIVLVRALSPARARQCFCCCLGLGAAAAGAACLLPGIAERALPHALVLASAGFIYMALSKLVPRMQQHASAAGTLPELLLIGLGVAIVALLDAGT